MKLARKLNPVARATGIIGATAALVTGITFAALSSTATLTQNSIASATAGLEVSSEADCATDETAVFSSLETGFDFVGIVPGTTPSQTETFCLSNTGTANLGIKVKVPTLPTFTDSLAASVDVDEDKVDVTIACTGDSPVVATLTALNTGDGVAMGSVAAATIKDCDVNVSMDADAFTADSVTSTDFDFVFTGTAI